MKTPKRTYVTSFLEWGDEFQGRLSSGQQRAYALPRHSYMPALTRGYILRHWKLLAPKHWCILRDIREHFHDATQWKLRHPANHLAMDECDLQEWVIFYNRLLVHPDTNLSPEERRNHPSLPSSATPTAHSPSSSPNCAPPLWGNSSGTRGLSPSVKHPPGLALLSSPFTMSADTPPITTKKTPK